MMVPSMSKSTMTTMRTTMKIEWDPPRTPHNLLQEQYFPDRWKVAVICMFLNCTQRKTAEPIVHKFFARYPTPEHYIWAYEWEAKSDIIDLIAPLGFGNRRAERIFKFSLDYLGRRLEPPERMPRDRRLRRCLRSDVLRKGFR